MRKVPTVRTTVVAETQPHLGDHAAQLPAFQDEILDRLREQAQARRRFERAAGGGTVQRAIDLGPGRAHGGSLARVERAEMDATGIGAGSHEAAERVDLSHEVAFADAAYSGIAGHLPEGFDVLREQQGARAHARGGERGFGAGVSAADDDDVELLGMIHGARRSAARQREGQGQRIIECRLVATPSAAC